MWTGKQWFIASLAVGCLITTINIEPLNATGVEETLAVLAVYFAVKYIRCLVCSDSGKAVTAKAVKPIVQYIMETMLKGKFPGGAGIQKIILTDAINSGQSNPNITFPGLAKDIFKCVLATTDLSMLLYDCEVERMKQIMIEVNAVIKAILPGVDVDAFETKSFTDFRKVMNIVTLNGLFGLQFNEKGDLRMKIPIFSDLPVVGSGKLVTDIVNVFRGNKNKDKEPVVETEEIEECDDDDDYDEDVTTTTQKEKYYKQNPHEDDVQIIKENEIKIEPKQDQKQKQFQFGIGGSIGFHFG